MTQPSGTVGAALAGTGAALGVLPLGTLNHFAKDLGIPLELEAAAGNLLSGQIVRVDVGEVNGRVFLNNSSLGLYPRVIRQREITREQLGWGKWPAFVWASLVMPRRYPLLEVCLRVRGTRMRRRTPFIFVGNNEYQIEGFDLGARQRLDGGHLSFYIARDVRRLGLLRLAVRALTRRLRDEKGFRRVVSRRSRH
ncbi:MAG: sphingosine kinase [Burkholderiales bacterium]|nr:sphingosine kinase [Burkholderiales bacterium]